MTLCSNIALTAGCGGSSSSDADASETTVLGRGAFIAIEDAGRDGVFAKAEPDD